MTMASNILRVPHRAGAIQLSLGILVVLLIGAAIFAPRFTDGDNVTNLLAQSTTLLLSAIGQSFVLITGGLDISVGSIISLTTAIMTLDLHPILRIAIAVAVATGFGLVNGYGVARLNVHPIIMTLSTMGIAQGLSFIVLPIPGGQIPSWLPSAVSGSLGPVPAPLIWCVLASAIGWFILNRTSFGLHLYAVGGHAMNARMNGVRTERIIISAYVLSALFACAAGLFLAGRLASGDPKGGAIYGIESVTAAALGGIHLAGGIGSIFGTIAGAAVLAIINNVMNLTNVSAFLQAVVKGLLLLLLVVAQRRKSIGL